MLPGQENIAPLDMQSPARTVSVLGNRREARRRFLTRTSFAIDDSETSFHDQSISLRALQSTLS